ncbi:MAG: acyl-CoA dehydrogenase domain protein [Firmicutes bacterium]|jgi:acyl-CoA dehydrogenase|nr:acyl-CoA dehydrogenase domain protein [Bacillota bacterium]
MERSLPYTQEHLMFKEAYSKFVAKEIVPNYEKWEENCIVDREIFKKLGDNGYLCTWADEKYGGAGGDFLYSAIIAEEMGRQGVRGCFSWLHSDIVGPYLDSFGTEEQKEKYLPGCVDGTTILAVAMTEPGAGSDLASMRATAVKDGDEYVLNGSKTFISNGILADLVVVAMKTDPKAGNKGITLFLVERDTPGFGRSKQIPKVGLHAQDTAELFFDNCRIPAANVLGGEKMVNQGFKCLMQKLQQERLMVALVNHASAERALDLTLQYVQERKLFGKALAQFQNTAFVLAEIATKLQLGRTFLDALVLQHAKHADVVKEVSMAKYWVGENENEVVAKCLQLYGGYGFCKEYEISRLFTDARVQTIYAGTSEVMKLIISRTMGLG